MAQKARLSVTSLRGLTTFPQAFRHALAMHPTGQQPIDMTWGGGGMWNGVRGYQPLRCDGNAELPNLDVAVLWRDQPAFLGRHVQDLLVGDPIHVDHVGSNSVWRRYAVRDAGPAADGLVADLLEEILTVAREVLHPRRGTFILKIIDQNHDDRPQRQAYLVNQLADELGFYVCGQWTMPSRSVADKRRQTVRHYPSALHLFILHLVPTCPYPGLPLMGRTKCAWCKAKIEVQRVGKANYCSPAHRKAAFDERQRTRKRLPAPRRIAATAP